MPPGEGASARAVPRGLVWAFVLSALAWVVAEARERAVPPVAESRLRWVALEALPEPADRPVLYVFSAAWCAPCVAQEEVLQSEALVEVLHRRVLLVKVVDRVHETGSNPEPVRALQERYGVTSFPTLVLRPSGEGKPQVLRGLQREEVIANLVGE